MITQLIKTSFLKLFLVSIGLLLFALPLVWLQFSHPHQFSTITRIVAQSSTLFTLFRLGLIALFVGGWPYCIREIAKKQGWHAEKTQFWLNKRFYISAWLIIFELFVCENLLLTLIKLF